MLRRTFLKALAAIPALPYTKGKQRRVIITSRVSDGKIIGIEYAA